MEIIIVMLVLGGVNAGDRDSPPPYPVFPPTVPPPSPPPVFPPPSSPAPPPSHYDEGSGNGDYYYYGEHYYNSDDLMVTRYTDLCDYADDSISCGDQCIYRGNCQCGSSEEFAWYEDDFCCLPSGGNCTKEVRFSSVAQKHWGVCSEGKKLSKSSYCENTDRSMQCRNSYQDSQYLSAGSHFTCPHSCVLWSDMCRGVSLCEGDHEVCGPDLRCPPKDDDYQIVTRHKQTSSLVSGHHYCLNRNRINDGRFDSIDRSDETEVKTVESALDLDISLFTPCNDSKWNSIPGFKCGSECWQNGFWCTEYLAKPCGTNTGVIRTDDPSLCSNPLVWREAPCIRYNDEGRVSSYGLRCRGNNMRCVYPWYTVDNGGDPPQPPPLALEVCTDKSDQVFDNSLTCRGILSQHMNYHTEKFCNENYDVQADLICTNKTQWLSEHDSSNYFHPYTRHYTNSSKLDPYSCQSSCSEPGPDCLACTNSSYFQCPISGQCVHPDLFCDGHPQCTEGEDEDLEQCLQKYIENKIVEPFASFKCKSPLYINMNIYATPCNNKKECSDGSDESDCQNNSKSNIVLGVSSAIVLMLFLGLNFYQYLSEKKSSTDNQEILIHNSTSEMLAKYKENHDDQQIVEEVNLHLLHSSNTETVEKNEDNLIAFYNLEVEKHNNDEAEIYVCIHKKLDADIIKKMISAKFPGFLEPFKKILRKQVNFIIKSEKAKRILSNTFVLIKIESKYIDLYKDLGLSFLMLDLIGGPQAIIDLPTNFGSVIVDVMFASIFLPMLLSTLHFTNSKGFAVTQYTQKGSTKMRRFLKAGLFYLMSPFHPILLDTLHHHKMEKARKLAQQYNMKAVQMMSKCRSIKKQLVTFIKIELGSNEYYPLILLCVQLHCSCFMPQILNYII